MNRDAAWWQKLFYQVILLGGALSLVLWVTIRLKVVTAPVIVGFFIAYALNPLVIWLRKHHVPAFVALTLPLALVIAVGILLIVVVIPGLASELLSASQTFPARLQALLVDLDPIWQRNFGIKPSSYFEPATLRDNLQRVVVELAGPATSVVGWLLSSARDLFLAAANVLLVFVAAAFMIDDYDRIVARCASLIPPRERPQITRIVTRIDEMMKGFLGGELVLFLLASISFTSGLLILNVPFAGLIGFAAALIYLVPYIGIILGAALAVAFSLLEDPSLATVSGVLAVFGTFYVIDLLFITPRIIGGRVGLTPLVVLLGIIAGGELFGIIGVLLAIPCLAVARILLVELVDAYQRSTAFRGRQTNSPLPADEDGA
ncbi:MAG: AI-2E family transporter [Myxococcales bacterium]|nr:AI-2E family transporter [Myxococcales bacterium]